MISNEEMKTTGVVAVCAIYVCKTMWDTVLKRSTQKGTCPMTERDNLLILQTHDVAMETKELLTQHFNELASVVLSIKDLTKSIADRSNEDSITQKQQTQILEKLTNAVINK